MDRRDQVERARGGDHDAFDAVARPSVARLDAAARLILLDRELARDAVQEGFIRAWRELPGLRDPDEFDGWLRRLVVRSSIDIARRRRHAIDDGDDEDRPRNVAADRDPLEAEFRRLDPERRAMVVMHAYLGMTPPDMARTAGLPLETATARLQRSLWIMRLALATNRAGERASAHVSAGATQPDLFHPQLVRLLERLANEPALDYDDDLFWQTERTSQRSAWAIPERWLG